MDTSEYIELFIEESEEHITTMSDELLKLENDHTNIEVVNTMFRSAHTIKGMAGSMGFVSMQNLTHKIENIMDDIRNGVQEPTQDMIDFMFKGIDRLEQILNEVKNGGTEVSSIDDLLEDMGSKSESIVDNCKFEFTDFEKSVLREMKDDGVYVYVIDLKLANECLLKYVRTNMFFNEVSKIGDIFKMNKSEEHIEDENLYDGTLKVVVLTEEEKDQFSSLKDKISEVDHIEVKLFDFDSLEREEKDDKISPEVKGKVANKSTKEEKANKNTNQSIRVSLDKLDGLMSAFEELVVEKGRLRELAQKTADKELLNSVDEIDKYSSDLQNGLLSMRMIPVDMIFNRFPRMVRNTSREMGKEIEFIIEGADTELDRTIVDELGDPLVHLLRNSLDHGVEMPEVREDRGKDRQGTIRIRATREGNEAVLEIKDDGNGIDTEKIKDKLIENGVYTTEEANELSVEELNQMIFSSGLSTAEEVTDISGRGVGLDVVRSKIESLGGNVKVESELGSGTSFIIKIPLTLSIIQALNVRDGEYQYLIPLSNIDDVVFLRSDMLQTLISDRVLKYRERILEIFKYSELMGENKDYDGKHYALIVKSGSKVYALLVDEIIGEAEIVLKPLSGYLSDVPGVVGATVLGDGRVAFVYDVNSF